jgi:hypothetical protein
MAAAKARRDDGCGGYDPDEDLGEADQADADELAGEHVAGLRNREHDLEDARGFLLNDGAGDVQAIHDGGHGEQDGHDVALVEGCDGVALDYGAIFLDLKGREGDAFVDGVCSAWLMPPLARRSLTMAWFTASLRRLEVVKSPADCEV